MRARVHTITLHACVTKWLLLCDARFGYSSPSRVVCRVGQWTTWWRWQRWRQRWVGLVADNSVGHKDGRLGLVATVLCGSCGHIVGRRAPPATASYERSRKEAHNPPSHERSSPWLIPAQHHSKQKMRTKKEVRNVTMVFQESGIYMKERSDNRKKNCKWREKAGRGVFYSNVRTAVRMKTG
jgi:hypothetical protein